MVLSAKLSGLLHIAAYLQHTNKKTCIFSDLLNMHENVSRLLYYIIFVVQNSLRWLSYEKIMLQLHNYVTIYNNLLWTPNIPKMRVYISSISELLSGFYKLF